MKVESLFDERTSTLTHVAYDPETRDAVIIDPVLDFDPASGRVWTESIDRLLALVAEHGLRVRLLLETHAHADHLSGSALLRRRLDVPLGIGERITEVQATFKKRLGLSHLPTDGRQFDRLLPDGAAVDAGSLRVEVIATPGHTPGCVTYRIGDALFTGDLLFAEDYGTGRTDFPGGDAEAMWRSVQRLYALPDETRVFPGHDYLPGGRPVAPSTTIGAEKARNPQLSATTAREAFVAFRRGRDATLSAPKLLYPSIQVNVDGGHLPPPDEQGRRRLVLPLDAASIEETRPGLRGAA